MAAAPPSPFRVRLGDAGAFVAIDIVEGLTSADIKETVAVAVGLPVGTPFSIKSAVDSRFSGFHWRLAGDWGVVVQPGAAAGAARRERARVRRGDDGEDARSFTDVVGPTFEDEARKVLEAVFREACPWAGAHSRVLSRVLDRSGNAREADVMCYVEGDTLAPCESLPVHGVRRVDLGELLPGERLAPLAAAEVPPDVRFSPTDSQYLGPHKYVLGEAYSGTRPAAMEDKVRQLDTLLQFMCARWEDRVHTPALADVTQLVGAAVLLFCAGDAPRHLELDRAVALVTRVVLGGGGGDGGLARLARLARAGRLLVVVLGKSQSPATFFQRAIAADLKRLGRLEALPEEVEGLVEGVRGEVEGVRGEVAALRAELASMRQLLERSAATSRVP